MKYLFYIFLCMLNLNNLVCAMPSCDFMGISVGDEITYKQSFIIGLYQCLALIPGTSRSASTIVGAMTQSLTRKAAAEFSFFLAVPTMLAVTVYSLFLKKYETTQLKGYELILEGDNIKYFLIGNAVAFVVAVLAIKLFIEVIKKYGFKPWGYYRIIAGVLLLIYFTLNK